VYADDHVLVVDKPAGLLSVPGRFLKDSVLQRVMFEHPDARVVHRLDLDTSGLLVMALTSHATSDLNRQFRERLVDKVYVAEVWGQMETDDGEIDLPMRSDPFNRPLQVVDHDKGKPALTRFRVLERRGASTLVALHPVTGRSHQLRVHLASLGHAILGCDLYASEAAFAAAERLCLHASELSFSHPGSGETVSFQSQYPFNT
jgi:tRNA pseudouridine32 synthase/23S rRNA pseudouridine746 synthase